jgi:hypothetical protein
VRRLVCLFSVSGLAIRRGAAFGVECVYLVLVVDVSWPRCSPSGEVSINFRSTSMCFIVWSQ